jgi:hypothetical protein
MTEARSVDPFPDVIPGEPEAREGDPDALVAAMDFLLLRPRMTAI